MNDMKSIENKIKEFIWYSSPSISMQNNILLNKETTADRKNTIILMFYPEIQPPK